MLKKWIKNGQMQKLYLEYSWNTSLLYEQGTMRLTLTS